MSTENISVSTVVCAACQANNASEAKFCKGCGHTLYEPCGKCTSLVSLGQKYCGDCGADLERIVAAKQQQYNDYMTKAVQAAKESDFETSLGLLGRVAEINDFRFRQSAKAADKALAQVKVLREKSIAIADQKIAEAKVAHQTGQFGDVVRILKGLPSNLMSEEVCKLYLESKTFVEELKSLEEAFSSASRDRDWVLAGGIVHQLQEALPGDRIYDKASQKIASKLFEQAKALFAKQQYAAAAKRLAAIPERSLTSESEELRHSIFDARWLSQAIDNEPFASPALGRLAIRFAKLVPDDSNAQQLVKEISSTLKQAKREPRCHLPRWKGNNTSSLGGDAHIFTRPRSIEVDETNETFRANLARFGVAMGLAVQGLGKARLKEAMFQKKQSIFGRKKLQGCWGVDIGTSSLKAVRMEWQNDKLVVTDIFLEDFATQQSQATTQQTKTERIKPTVESFLAAHDIGDSAVWANLPGFELTTRFVRLPPVPDKKAMQLLDQEIADRIPIAADDLIMTKSIGAFDKEDSHGRAAVVSAARKAAVDQRVEILTDAGLDIDGLQADPIALVNLVAWEFSTLLSAPEPTEVDDAIPQEANDDTDAKSNKKKPKQKAVTKARFA